MFPERDEMISIIFSLMSHRIEEEEKWITENRQQQQQHQSSNLSDIFSTTTANTNAPTSKERLLSSYEFEDDASWSDSTTNTSIFSADDVDDTIMKEPTSPDFNTTLTPPKRIISKKKDAETKQDTDLHSSKFSGRHSLEKVKVTQMYLQLSTNIGF